MFLSQTSQKLPENRPACQCGWLPSRTKILICKVNKGSHPVCRGFCLSLSRIHLQTIGRTWWKLSTKKAALRGEANYSRNTMNSSYITHLYNQWARSRERPVGIRYFVIAFVGNIVKTKREIVVLISVIFVDCRNVSLARHTAAPRCFHSHFISYHRVCMTLAYLFKQQTNLTVKLNFLMTKLMCSI